MHTQIMFLSIVPGSRKEIDDSQIMFLSIVPGSRKEIDDSQIIFQYLECVQKLVHTIYHFYRFFEHK